MPSPFHWHSWGLWQQTGTIDLRIWDEFGDYIVGHKYYISMARSCKTCGLIKTKRVRDR